MTRRTHEDEALLSNEGGVVYVEFLIAFLPVFMLFLGMLQGALMYGANLVVTHAANRAARSAAVVLDAPESDFDGEDRMTIDYGQASNGSAAMCLLLRVLSASCSFTGGSGSNRLNAIRAAASFPLLAVSPSAAQQTQDAQVYRAIGGDPLFARAVNGAFYNRAAVSVTFPDHPQRRFTVAQDENLRVRVTYLFHCGIPIASRYMCDDPASVASGIPNFQSRELARLRASGNATPNEINEHVRRVRSASARLRETRGAMDDLNMSEMPELLGLIAFNGGRYHVLRAESRFVVHSASYEYSN